MPRLRPGAGAGAGGCGGGGGVRGRRAVADVGERVHRQPGACRRSDRTGPAVAGLPGRAGGLAVWMMGGMGGMAEDWAAGLRGLRRRWLASRRRRAVSAGREAAAARRGVGAGPTGNCCRRSEPGEERPGGCAGPEDGSRFLTLDGAAAQVRLRVDLGGEGGPAMYDGTIAGWLPAQVAPAPGPGAGMALPVWCFAAPCRADTCRADTCACSSCPRIGQRRDRWRPSRDRAGKPWQRRCEWRPGPVPRVLFQRR